MTSCTSACDSVTYIVRVRVYNYVTVASLVELALQVGLIGKGKDKATITTLEFEIILRFILV